jgi:hypothetical protein
MHQHEVNSSGKVSVLVPRFTGKFLNFIFAQTKNKFIRMNLDEPGSETWLLIDGQKNVGEICRLLQDKMGERIHPVEERVTKFLTELHKHKFVRFNELK